MGASRIKRVSGAAAVSAFRPVQPPFSNTGAEESCGPLRLFRRAASKKKFVDLPPVSVPLENRVLLDYVSVTFTAFTDPALAISAIGLHGGLFSDMPTGAMGYKCGLRYGNISIFYDGAPGMGVHVSMTGQGCRQYESQFKIIQDLCIWRSFFTNVHINGGKFTRLDIAIDNVDGQLSIIKLQEAVTDGKIKSRFKKARKITSYTLSSKEAQFERGTTLYFGAAQSRLQIRVYDKAEEQNVQCDHWVRCELQLRAERAEYAASVYRNGKELVALATESINHYVAPIEHDNNQVQRCSVQCWWAEWLGTTKKLRLTTASAMKYVSEVADYIKKQYAPSIAMIKEHLGLGFSDFITDLLAEGKERMTVKHRQILAISQL